jgi:DUF917 family protein
MGAPLVSIEKLPSGRECQKVLELIKSYTGKLPKAIVAAEIGGSNAFVPLNLGAMSQIPVLDADMLGRAFPELQMSSCALAGISCSPAFIADSLGNSSIIEASHPKKVELLARALTEAMGSSVAVALYLMTGKEAKSSLVAKSLSCAVAIGNQVLTRHFHASSLATGILVDIQQDIQNGFLHGKVKIVGQDDTCEVLFQNEYLVARTENQILASTPDIIAIIERESALPLPVEQLKFGLAVDVIALASPEIWKAPKALQLVGPRAFGYDFDYKGVSDETV